jgi:hypothetical protein
MFKSAFIVMAADGDPEKYRAIIKTSKIELTVVLIKLLDFDQGVKVAKELVQNKGVQSIYLCAGFSHQAVGRIADAVGDKVSIMVARGDTPSLMLTIDNLTKEGWFNEEKGP